MTRPVLSALAFTAFLLAAAPASAQQVYMRTPFQQLNNSFFENYNIGWGHDGRRADGSGFFFNGIGPARPPFGNFDPNSEAAFGVGNGRSFFNFSASQGNSSTLSTEIPSVMVPNGHGGSISNTSLRPFVTGFIPVVGDCGTRYEVPGAFPLLVAPQYPTFNFQPNYTSPLGASREEIYQNIERAKQQAAAELLAQRRDERKDDAEALAQERARLKKRVRQGGNDDPPLRLSGDQ